MCDRFNLACEGYEIRLTFDDLDDGTTSKYRRPLYTERERQRMSDSLVSSIEQVSTQRLLSKLDSEIEAVSQVGGLDVDIVRGPFTVFQAKATEHLWEVFQDANTESVSYAEDSSLDDSDTLRNSTAQAANEDIPWYTESGEIAGELEAFPYLIEDVAEGLPLLDSIHGSSTPLPTWLSAATGEPPFLEFASLLPSLSSHGALPENAEFLLSNYKDTVIGLLSPSPRRRKGPWQVLHLPSAMNTLALLMLGDQPSHASLSIFHSIMAISAYSLRGSLSGDVRQCWNSKGDDHKLKAQLNLKLTLQDAFTTPKKAKYKDILMSLLTMVTVSVSTRVTTHRWEHIRPDSRFVQMFAGSWEQVECYLLDSERFIRANGLTKPRMSRKVRLLHHCYAYLRLFHESTSAWCSRSQQDKQYLLADCDTSRVARDRSSFRLGSWNADLDQMLSVTKDLQEGYCDLHLEIPADFPQTLYPDIYGIPEVFMVLLSQVIRLGNELDIMNESNDQEGLSYREFSRRAKALEECVIKWEPPLSDSASFSGNPPDASQVGNIPNTEDMMLKALHHALIIYFYRRIYDVDASILQSEVDLVRTCLLECREPNGTVQYTSGFVWPGFIAACEALDTSVQQSFTSWFVDCAARSGLETFSSAHDAVQQIWRLRRDRKETNFSWRNYMKNNSQRLFYS